MIGDTIVVVDDEPDLLGLVQAVLVDEGYQVVPVGHPEMIANAIAGQEPSLFLIDLMLPGTNGIAVAERLHTGGYGAIPMIAMSASRVMTAAAARSGWFSGTIHKPFDLDRFIGCIRDRIDEPGTAAGLASPA